MIDCLMAHSYRLCVLPRYRYRTIQNPNQSVQISGGGLSVRELKAVRLLSFRFWPVELTNGLQNSSRHGATFKRQKVFQSVTSMY